MQQSSISRIAQIRYFYRFPVNLCFASAAFFAPVIPSCIRYPDVPVCKKCTKMCRAKISPLKQVSDFYAKPGKRSGSSPIRQLRSCLFRPSIKCTSNNHDSWQGFGQLNAIKARGFSDALIANQRRYNLESTNNIVNSSGRRVRGFVGIEALVQPDPTPNGWLA